jgi:hypothetical protein
MLRFSILTTLDSVESSMDITKGEIMVQHLWRILPKWIMKVYSSLHQARMSKRFRQFRGKAAEVGYKLLAEQTKPGTSLDKFAKDVLSVLSECLQSTQQNWKTDKFSSS